MRAAIDRVDGVGERQHVFTVGVVVLESDLDFDVALLTFHVDRRIMQGGLAAIQMLDEFRDAAGEAELRGFFRALIREGDLQAFVEESVFAKARSQNVVAEADFFKNGSVRMKSHLRSGLARFPGLAQLRGRLALFIALLPNSAITLNFELEPVRKRVYHGNADAVQSARYLVGLAVKLTSGVQNGHDDFRRRTLLGGVHVDRNAAAVVDDGNGVVGMNRDVDLVGKARHRFVNGIVDNFPYEVVQTHFAGRADVHGRTQAHSFETAKHLNGFGVVLMAHFSRHGFFVAHVLSLAANRPCGRSVRAYGNPSPQNSGQWSGPDAQRGCFGEGSTQFL